GGAAWRARGVRRRRRTGARRARDRRHGRRAVRRCAGTGRRARRPQRGGWRRAGRVARGGAGRGAGWPARRAGDGADLEGLGAPQVAMTFVGPRLCVALVTVHEPLAAVPGLITAERIVAVGELLATCLARDLGRAAPVRLGVVGLNPHAGEGGLLGGEDAAV